MAPTSAVLLLAAATTLLGALALVKKRELLYYVQLEHINLTYWNPKYYKYAKLSTVRYSRKDPNYYLNLHGETLVTFGNNLTIDAYIYEFLSNEYRRSFVEFHGGFCDLMFHDKNLSPFLNKLYPRCPVPPKVSLGEVELMMKTTDGDRNSSTGPYDFENLTVPSHPILKRFPFTKGRFYGTISVRGTGERVSEAYVDATIKQKRLNN